MHVFWAIDKIIQLDYMEYVYRKYFAGILMLIANIRESKAERDSKSTTVICDKAHSNFRNCNCDRNQLQTRYNQEQ